MQCHRNQHAQKVLYLAFLTWQTTHPWPFGQRGRDCGYSTASITASRLNDDQRRFKLGHYVVAMHETPNVFDLLFVAKPAALILQ